MESQPQNPEFRKNPENFHQCTLSSNEGSGWSEPLLFTQSIDVIKTD